MFIREHIMDHKRIIVQWLEFEIPPVFPRASSIDLELDFVWTVIGARRVGKTFFCFQTIGEFIKKGVPKKNILYINFEDEKLLGADAEDLNKLLDAYFELSAPSKKYKTYLFLDEIQNVTNWDAWVRRVHDTEKNLKIVLTGSSSKLLSKEISTRLRGRVMSCEIFPVSFRELLSWKNIDYDLKTIAHSKQRFKIKKLFGEYLTSGGFPAIVLNPHYEEDILQRYYDSMIFRDVVERHNIKDAKKLKILGKMLFERVAGDLSYNKLANQLKSAGYDFSTNTVIEYISHFEDAYVFFQNIRYEYSLTKQLGAIKKLYCIDNGLLNSVSFKFSEDLGKLVENLIFISLKCQGRELYYYRGDYECDFLIKEKNKIVGALQVTAELNEDTYQREVRGLVEAMDAYTLKEGTVVVYEGDAKEEIIDGKKIRTVPAWLWLLG